MPFEATNVGSLMLLIVWACIIAPTSINPTIRTILPTNERLSELFDLAGFTFCPGLFDVIQAASSPPLRWFESLSSTIPKNVWGVYVLVLTKRGHPPLLYVGSGTATRKGVKGRIYEHRVGVLTPHYVKDALRKGYKITHIALLAHCPIPAAADGPKIRIVVVALEAAFSCVFWAMYNRNKSYGLDTVCPWSRDSFQWGGLCSHSSLNEPINGDFGLTPEELEEIAAVNKERDRVYQLAYQKELRKNPTEQYKATQNANNKKQAPATKARQEEAVASKQYHCDVCDVSCRDNASLIRHNKTPRHKKKTIMGDEDFLCAACNLSFRYQSNFNQHKTSKGHIANVAKSSRSS